ncbi:hypothetical protein DRF60_00320 [Chryseobacterium elymi]|uniref:Uncharacterized protein n=1 Tax=Chryseobacterium elymi TaxID=395936 RepID=A0A3D9DQM6_9FLAO|nr:hypothetical protein DRF60_00320 [Chryseobacterium elymi]
MKRSFLSILIFPFKIILGYIFLRLIGNCRAVITNVHIAFASPGKMTSSCEMIHIHRDIVYLGLRGFLNVEKIRTVKKINGHTGKNIIRNKSHGF